MLSSVSYTAVLDVKAATVAFLVERLNELRRGRRTRAGTRALSTWGQAILVLRWFVDRTRMTNLVRDNAIALSTGYKYLHEGIDVLAACAPSLTVALEGAKSKGWSHVNLDGTVIAMDRCRTKGPGKADLWWSGKHGHRGGNVQVLSDPDGWPIWVSHVRPGRQHDITCAKAHEGLIEGLEALEGNGILVMVDLGYLGMSPCFRLPRKKPSWRKLFLHEQVYNRVFRAIHGIGERANALLKVTFKALRRVSLDPRRIGSITKAAHTLLHIEHNQPLPGINTLRRKAHCLPELRSHLLRIKDSKPSVDLPLVTKPVGEVCQEVVNSFDSLIDADNLEGIEACPVAATDQLHRLCVRIDIGVGQVDDGFISQFSRDDQHRRPARDGQLAVGLINCQRK